MPLRISPVGKRSDLTASARSVHSDWKLLMVHCICTVALASSGLLCVYSALAGLWNGCTD